MFSTTTPDLFTVKSVNLDFASIFARVSIYMLIYLPACADFSVSCSGKPSTELYAYVGNTAVNVSTITKKNDIIFFAILSSPYCNYSIFDIIRQFNYIFFFHIIFVDNITKFSIGLNL